MSSLETSLLPCLLKWIEHSHYSKCPVNFPAVFTASNFKSPVIQLAIFYPPHGDAKIPSLHNWEFPTERKPRTGGLGGLNRWWVGDVRGGLVTSILMFIVLIFSMNHNQIYQTWFLDGLNVSINWYILIYVSFQICQRTPNIFPQIVQQTNCILARKHCQNHGQRHLSRSSSTNKDQQSGSVSALQHEFSVMVKPH